MHAEGAIYWEPSQEAARLLRHLYRNRAKKPIIIGLMLSYAGLVFIPPEGENMFAMAAIPIHIMILLFWAATYWYFGSKKFAPSRCCYIPSTTPKLVVDGWTTENIDFQIIKEYTCDTVVKIEGSLLGYISIPKDVMALIKNQNESKNIEEHKK